MKSKRKIVIILLTLVGLLALTSIFLLGEQLIVRHLPHTQTLAGDEQQQQEEEILEIVTIDAWIKNTKVVVFGDRNEDKKKSDAKSIFWDSEVEASIAPGLNADEVQYEIESLRSRKVKAMHEPDWLHCGRQKNRFIEFQDGTFACARNRGMKHAEFVQGEVMAFYLARLLGIHNVPAVTLSKVTSNQWDEVSSKSSNWTQQDIVALIQWIPNLTKVTLPPTLKRALISNKPYSLDEFEDGDAELKSELAQWSDLVIFDFITGNYDRVIGMQVKRLIASNFTAKSND